MLTFFFVKFDRKRSTRILQVGTKYSVYDMISEVVHYCASSCNVM